MINNKEFHDKLKDIVFEVLSNYQNKDIKNENIRLEIADTISVKYKNFVKEVAKSVIGKKAIEAIENRVTNKIIKP